MTWQHTINKALVRSTGFQFNRVGKAGFVPVVASADEKKELIRPPADPQADRLLTAPVFILSPVRSGSTLLRALLGTHSMLHAPHAPHELHVRRLGVDFGTSLSEKAMGALGHNRADLEHLLWDRVLHRELVRSGKSFIWKDKIQTGTVQRGRDLPAPQEIPQALQSICRTWGYLPEPTEQSS